MSETCFTGHVTIDVVSDVICPWCFLGKRRLDRALSLHPDTPVDIRWRPFLLDATIPQEGIPRQVYLERKFGPERLKTIHDPLKAAGDAEGIPYAFDRITVTPNTLNAHRLLRWAQVKGLQHRMAERLFQLYWLEGADVGSSAVLIDAAAQLGLDSTVIARLLAGDADLDAIIEEIATAAEIGITGVPTFIFGGHYAVVGAQPPEVLASAIMRVALETRAQ
jgi:predicted DsbA family dithiol-disulfide isomerase